MPWPSNIQTLGPSGPELAQITNENIELLKRHFNYILIMKILLLPGHMIICLLDIPV